MRAAWLACFLWVAPAFAANPDVLDPNAITQCDGGTFDMSQCMQAEVEKAEKLLGLVNHSYSLYIDQLQSQANADAEHIQHLREALAASQTHFAAYVKTMGELVYWSDYPGTIRQISTPMVRHKLIMEQIMRLLTSCTGMIPDQTEFDLTHEGWCVSDALAGE